MRHSKANIRCILGFIGILLFASASGQGLDLRLLENINGARNTHLDNGFHVLSESAIPVTLSIPTSFLATGLIKKDSAIFMQGLTMVTGLALNTYLTYAIKYTINRARPYEAFPARVDAQTTDWSPSLPSGHTSIAFTTATNLSIALPKWYVVLPAYTWASAVAYSRLHLGVHYPSDVIIGALIGSGSAWISHRLNQRIFK